MTIKKSALLQADDFKINYFYYNTIGGIILTEQFPYLLNRMQASQFLGLDPKSFDKYIRSSNELKRFMIGTQERFTQAELTNFIETHSITE